MSLSKSTNSYAKEVFEQIAQSTQFADKLHELLCGENVTYCQDFDHSKVQESWSWRNVHAARELAKLLIDDRGEINHAVLLKAIQLIEQNLYSLGPERYLDAPRLQHVLKTLKLFHENPIFPRALKRLSQPSGNSIADRLIRETLSLPENVKLTDAHTRAAALSALLTYLRQNVGSCFATAPAILVQQEYPLRFLDDIGQLFGTGRLTRITEGVESSVPLSISWGMGDLLKPIPLVALGENPLDVLALSPGLQEAFVTVGLIDLSSSREEKIERLKTLLKTSGLPAKSDDLLTFVIPERLIQQILLQAFGITQSDVDAYNARTVIQGPIAELIVQTPSILGSKNLVASRYLKAVDDAKRAFKALTDNALLKAWEFTLASLSESQADFAKWNLYISLGIQPDEPNGIGESIHHLLQTLLEDINAQITAFQSNYDHLYAQAKYLEGRITRSETERDAEWLRAEYQIRRHEINRALSERDQVYEKGKKLQAIYPQLIDFYGMKIREYFQEVYDAQMHDVTVGPYDDSPAGFRLMYKFGRAQTSLWTMIYTPAEYIQHLTSFFVATEVDLIQIPFFQGLQKEIADIVTAVITTIKRPEFLESSFMRLAKAYNERLVNDPLNHLDQVKRKPWSYVSGGTMATLVKCYWGSPLPPKEEKRWIENETEFLAFIIDTMRELPLSVQRQYQQDVHKNMLCFSPTHAFLAKPGWQTLRLAWESNLYAYTWVKEQWLPPQQNFLADSLLDARMMDWLANQLIEWIPQGYRGVARHALKSFPFAMTAPEFREFVIQALSYEKWLSEGHRLTMIGDQLDSILYQSLPLFPGYELEKNVKAVIEGVEELSFETKDLVYSKLERFTDKIGKYQTLSAADLRETLQALLMETLQVTRTQTFYIQKILKIMRNRGLAFPEPFLFADTNWVNNVFGFTVNPGTNVLELWRFDNLGLAGRPMTAWKRYLNGIDRKEWGFYTNPGQYT